MTKSPLMTGHCDLSLASSLRPFDLSRVTFACMFAVYMNSKIQLSQNSGAVANVVHLDIDTPLILLFQPRVYAGFEGEG